MSPNLSASRRHPNFILSTLLRPNQSPDPFSFSPSPTHEHFTGRLDTRQLLRRHAIHKQRSHYDTSVNTRDCRLDGIYTLQKTKNNGIKQKLNIDKREREREEEENGYIVVIVD